MDDQSLKCNTHKITEELIKKNIKKKSDLEITLYNIKKEIIDVKLRGQAQIENIRKNSTIEIQKIRKKQLIMFAKKIICVADHLDAILKISNKKNINDNHIIQGITLILKSLLNIFSKMNIKIENKKNVIFQPHLHESTKTIKLNNIPSNYIISILQPGYTLNNEVLRKAKVEVSC